MKKTNDSSEIVRMTVFLPNGLYVCVKPEEVEIIYNNWKRNVLKDLERSKTVKLNQKCPECGGELYQTGDGIWCDTCHYNIFKN